MFVLLALPALGAALAITFAADHSVRFGLIVLGAFGLGTAITGAAAAALLPSGTLRRLGVLRALVAAGAGALGLSALGWALPAGHDEAAAAAALGWVIAAGLGALAIVDAVIWSRTRRRDRSARDWLTIAIIELVGAVAPLLVPANYLLPYVVHDKETVLPLVLTASIIMVGIVGAVLAILGVFLVIAGLSQLPARRPASQHDVAVNA